MGFVFIAIITTVINSSCERNVCNNVYCLNGGSCSGGTCLCPLGYEGPQCQTLSITRYLGTYVGYSNCTYNGVPGTDVFDTANIEPDGVAINTVSIKLHSISPKVIHGYVSSNVSTYSIIVTNNDSLSIPHKTIYDKTFTATVQNDNTLSLVSYTMIQDSTDSINDKCIFLGTKL